MNFLESTNPVELLDFLIKTKYSKVCVMVIWPQALDFKFEVIEITPDEMTCIVEHIEFNDKLQQAINQEIGVDVFKERTKLRKNWKIGTSVHFYIAGKSLGNSKHTIEQLGEILEDKSECKISENLKNALQQRRPSSRIYKTST
jgi:hypothetical protein